MPLQTLDGWISAARGAKADTTQAGHEKNIPIAIQRKDAGEEAGGIKGDEMVTVDELNHGPIIIISGAEMTNTDDSLPVFADCGQC